MQVHQSTGAFSHFTQSKNVEGSEFIQSQEIQAHSQKSLKSSQILGTSLVYED